jgi:hypothetical protein
MQLLSLQALLLVWLVGGMESLLVGREDIKRSGVRELLSAPIPGISFVLTIIALVVAVPTSCFFATESRRQQQLLAKAPQTIASPSRGIPSSSTTAVAANGVRVDATAEVAVPVASNDDAAAAEGTADAEEADLEMPPPSASAVCKPSRLPTPPLSRPPEATVRRRNSATPPKDDEKHEHIDSVPIEHAAV